MLVVFLSTLLSCLVFDLIKTKSTSYILINSYKELPSILKNDKLSDEEKQTILLNSSKLQLKYLFVLSSKIMFILSPFLSLLLFDLNPLILLERNYILITISSVFLYLIFKNIYEKTFKNK